MISSSEAEQKEEGSTTTTLVNVVQSLAKLELKAKAKEKQRDKRLEYYSSKHNILLVGEGDFSFSMSLARAFRSAFNITATCYDYHDDLVMMYAYAKNNLKNLRRLDATLVYGVDASSMIYHRRLKLKKFDRIIFNFPHAGFDLKEDEDEQIEAHKEVVNGFFKNARYMLRPDGEVHVNHKTGYPYYLWDIKGLARENSLVLTECIAFNIDHYPGYVNKRGSGLNCDDTFWLGECSTFKFKLSS
ncbi:hypothetical protein ACFE04_022577 [Oxalis oulophora]